MRCVTRLVIEVQGDVTASVTVLTIPRPKRDKDPERTIVVHALVIRTTTVTRVDVRNDNVSVKEASVEALETV